MSTMLSYLPCIVLVICICSTITNERLSGNQQYCFAHAAQNVLIASIIVQEQHVSVSSQMHQTLARGFQYYMLAAELKV